MQKSSKMKNIHLQGSVHVETYHWLQLCDGSWGHGQIYRRFMRSINKTEHKGIAIFNNVYIEFTGLMAAIEELNRKNSSSLKKMGESKSLRYFGTSEKMRKEIEGLGKQLEWHSARKYVVNYKNEYCGKVVILGKGSE